MGPCIGRDGDCRATLSLAMARLRHDQEYEREGGGLGALCDSR